MSSRQYSLESLLLGITPHHQKLIIEKGFVPYTDHQLANQLTHQSTKKSVEIIVRVGGRPIHFLKRCLDSIAHQTYQNIGIVIVKYQEIAGLENLLKQYTDRLFIKVIETQFSGFRSTQLMAGINAVTSEYFGILDDDDLIHPNHVFLLVSLLESSSHLGVAYSGSIRVWESDKSDRIQKHKRFDKQDNQHNPYYETAKLHYFEDFSLKKILRFKNFISSNSFIAKRSLLCDEFNFDPQLKVGEDFFVLLNLCRRANFVFSYEATCEFYWRQSKRDNSSFDSDWVWEESVNRIKYLFEGKSFANSLYLVRSSKFWQLKVLWIKLKRLALAFWDRVR
ncbi:MAG: glycosyltransferase family A protein [Pseudanabaenaceae cyanobacterium bins.39]|nr:glycosyltransferase family A protein [Pseudanabaenaceae cyanobacterium bins.39]